MDHRRQGPACPAPACSAKERAEKKTPRGLIEAFDRLWAEARPGFGQERTWRRARALALGALVGLGRRTVTGLLSATGQQQRDWSAAYRLFSRQRLDSAALFAPLRRTVAARLGPKDPLVALMDDTVLRKRGRKVAATKWLRDPLGPKFQTNLIWGQRMLQLSAALPEQGGGDAVRARGIPIDMTLCLSPRKPRKGAAEEEWNAYRERMRRSRLSVRGAQRIAQLRSALDGDQQRQRPLIISVDGGYTNATVINTLPERTTLVGRVRKDAKLYRPPIQQSGRGRRRKYGEPLPTPAQLAADPAIPWQPLQLSVAGQLWQFQAKRISPLRWRGTGDKDLCLLILACRSAPPGRPSHRVWHDPVYLIATDPDLPSQRIGQAFLWRWEIELNFRDQKTLLGTGQAQVRSAEAAQAVPALIGAAYGMMHLAIDEWSAQNDSAPTQLPRPRWQRMRAQERRTTGQAQGLMRAQLWGRALGVENFSHFARAHMSRTKHEKFIATPASAVLYASG